MDDSNEKQLPAASSADSQTASELTVAANTEYEDIHNSTEGNLTWSFSQYVEDVRAADLVGGREKHLALTWKDLTVKGVAASESFMPTVWSNVNPVENIRAGKPTTRNLLNGFNGQLLPGEMLLVVGRPGSGCTTFLKTLANKRESFANVEGEVNYGSLTAKQAEGYRQQILFNSEEDVHFPTLAVGQMLKFALHNKVPRTRDEGMTKKEFVKRYETSLMKALGIAHTKQTQVGNEFVRGVSGGERKRVSIAEVLAGRSPIQVWDNSTRGLDASTALDFTKALRTLANKERKTIIATFYQAGNSIYDLFDKVCLIEEGRELYYGPRALAQKYFEDMGFVCPRGANIADFLSAVVVPSERQVKPGFEHRVPTSAEDFEAAFKKSDIYRQMNAEFQSVDSFDVETDKFVATVKGEVRTKKWGRPSPYTVSLTTQVIACTVRQVQILWGDRQSMFLKFAGVTAQALINGSSFVQLSEDSDSTFTRPGALFFPIIYFCMEAMSETTKSFMGRPILARQKDFGLYRPTAYAIACTIVDIPITLIQVSIFSIIYYFMCGFQMDAGTFFIFWLLLNITALCFTAFYRMIGALCNSFGNASKVSGMATMVMLMYAGYLIPFNKMRVWFRWIARINPASYIFESLMVNEFAGRIMQCNNQQLVPFGPGYDDAAHQVCTVAGSDGVTAGGLSYLEHQYGFKYGHLWRGFGVTVAFWLFFMAMTALGYERLKDQSSAAGLLYKRGTRTAKATHSDEEGAAVAHAPVSEKRESPNPDAVSPSGAVFSWKNIQYTVDIPGGKKLQLLTNISGFVKPGQLVALMGSSGAGKTTLLDVLAQRKDSGEVLGEILMDGRPLDASFQRNAGYCEQLDIHESSATVREALIFSARLRQPATVSDEEKIAYVDQIIHLLELEDIQDAQIGIQGAGLAVEQRKRLTIGVELVAKPSILFLDEPTSGLDGQSAFNVVRFMKKLAEQGQAVVCTIHQPSASLFDAFDSLLLLQKGGRTSYFGETGSNSEVLLDYFARNGAPCPPNVNPAEHIVDVVQGRLLPGVDWADLWAASNEGSSSSDEQAQINARCAAAPPSTVSDGREFATDLRTQLKIVTERHIVALWRKPDYIMNKIMLHIMAALFGGFTFYQVGNGVFDLQLRLFAVFNFLFVASGVIAQLQPLFIANRDIFEAREKKSKTYGWVAFVTAQLIAEIPWLILCGTLYFAAYYFTVGFPVKASISGQVWVTMIFYEFLYTAVGQAIATYSPNEYFAALVNPFILGALFINFSGVLVPYTQMNIFWKHWFYWMNPFHYVIEGMLTQLLYSVKVVCNTEEFSRFSPPAGETCGQYLENFMSMAPGYLENADATEMCEYCPFKEGGEYAKTFGMEGNFYGWRGTGILVLFCIAFYGIVYGLMKLRSKKTKSAKAEE